MSSQECCAISPADFCDHSPCAGGKCSPPPRYTTANEATELKSAKNSPILNINDTRFTNTCGCKNISKNTTMYGTGNHGAILDSKLTVQPRWSCLFTSGS